MGLAVRPIKETHLHVASTPREVGVSHSHEYLVIAGRLRMGLRDGDVDLESGEFIIVPHGVEHRPETLTDECQILLLEPKTTLNTGNVINE
jgi:mannose-6-phosphate isomerase-like protein (cupin superfamily)